MLQNLELVRSVLARIPLYLLSVIKFPMWAITLINSQMEHCLWNNYEGHHKYHLANWGLVSQKKRIWRFRNSRPGRAKHVFACHLD
jgi:hypothetical protein